MANLVQESVWNEGIYQLETTDPVMGGPEGIDNLQAKQLANRTLYLRSMGICEWDKSISYKIGSIVNEKGSLYISLVDNNLNNSTTIKNKWMILNADASINQKGFVQLISEIITDDETKAVTSKAILKALAGYLPASKVDDVYKVTDDVNFKKTPKINDIELVYLTDSYSTKDGWYEKYSNGLVRQGAVAQMKQASSQTVIHTAVNLLVPVINGDYNVILTSANSSGNWGNTIHTFSAQSNTNFIISSYCSVQNTQISQIYWEMRGLYK